MTDGVTFLLEELRRLGWSQLDRKLRNYAKDDEELYEHLSTHLRLAKTNIERLQPYIRIRITKSGVQVPYTRRGGKGPHQYYVTMPL